MKTINPLTLIFVFSLFLTPATAFAQEATLAPTASPGAAAFRQGLRSARHQYLGELRANRLQARTTIAQNRREVRLRNAQVILNRITEQFTDTFNYFGQVKTLLSDRIASRAATNDMTQAQAKLAGYDALAATFQTDFANFTQTANTAIGSSEIPGQIVSTIRLSARTVRTDLKNIRQLLMDTLRLMINAPKK
ncbi:hypothetical protein M1116_04315 [Patescibacteria group bacterium]|nr:hypothetical protein [Patescibacteria group bacterium]